MRIPEFPGGGSPGGDDGAARKREAAPFALTGPPSFLPQQYPETVRVRRQRNLTRNQDFCEGENVTDNGAKNREIHVNGWLVGLEKNSFNNVLNHNGTLDLTSAPWSGEVRVDEGEYEGPVGWDPQSGYYYYEYTLDLVSTGAELRDPDQGNGIVQEGSGANPGRSVDLETGL